MRIYLNPDDSALLERYSELFNELATETGANVVDLPSYFAALKAKLDNNEIPKYKYFRLPLDEPYFQVNMSNRIITVPQEFNNYGLGVKGDANAELVFFEVDRFYDTVDLYDEDLSCWIQWQNTSDKTASGRGNSVGILKDATEDKIYIGWIITENMTKVAGSLEFTLRWFRRENNEITYSVSTQKASCAIKNSLDLDVGLQPDTNIESLVLNRPIYSGIINSMDGAAPVILTNLDNTVIYNLFRPELDENEADYDEANATMYTAAKELLATALLVGENRDHDGIYKFTVVAQPAATGNTLSYRWYKNGSQLNDQTSASYVAYEAGKYQVSIGNYQEGSGTRWVMSNVVDIPAANAIKVDPAHVNFPTNIFSANANNTSQYTTLNYGVIDAANGTAANGTVTYKWVKTNLEGLNSTVLANNASTYTPTEDDEGIIKCYVSNRLNNTIATELISNQCQVRALPKAITGASLSYSNRQIVADNIVTTGPSIDHTNEYVYTWYVSVNGQAFNSTAFRTYTSNFIDVNPTYVPNSPDGTTIYRYYCIIQHVVRNGNLPAQYGAAGQSDPLELRVSSDGTITE